MTKGSKTSHPAKGFRRILTKGYDASQARSDSGRRNDVDRSKPP